MNTVIFSVYDDYCSESSILVSDYVGVKAVRTTDFRFRCLPDLRYDEVSDFTKFNSFEAIFNERVDRILIIENARLIDSMTKVAGFGNEDYIYHGSGQLLERIPKLRRKTDDGESGKRRFKKRVDKDG